MTCQDFDDQFDAYARGELRDDVATALEQHAAECAACAMRLERLRQVDVAHFIGDAALQQNCGEVRTYVD